MGGELTGHVENLKPGDWVVVTAHKCRECGADHRGGHDGEPHQVLAVQPPFLLLRLNKQRKGRNESRALDVREWDFRRVGSFKRPGAYVCAWMQSNHPEQCGGAAESGDGHPRCVRCGERLRQVNKGRQWWWRCECGFDGGPVEAQA